MAQVLDIRPYGQNQLKKSVSLSTATIDVKRINGSYGSTTPGELNVDDSLILFQIPPMSVIVNAGVIVKSKATATTAQFKLTVGAKDVMDATAVGGASDVVIGSLKGKLYLPTGGDLKATVLVAKLSDGVFEAFVEYYEVGKVTGELTN